MSAWIWSLEDLIRHTKSGDPEVRSWAVDRLIRHFPAECCDAIANLLLDEHDVTPPSVARHLGEQGGSKHFPMLLRGLRVLRGMTPGYCLQALVRLGHPGVVELAAGALKRGDLPEPTLGLVLESLAEVGTPAARDVVLDFVGRKVELLAEPAALRGVLRVCDVTELPTVLSRFVAALHWRGSHRAGEAFRTLMDALQVDDAAWCFRTGPSGHIELRKTIKAVESGYDCDISTVIGRTTINHIAQRFRKGDLEETIRAIAEWTGTAARQLPASEGSDLPQRIAAGVAALARPDLVSEMERLGHQVQQWLIGFQLSAAFAVARGRNFQSELADARDDLDRLLELAETETAFLVSDLPSAVASICREDPERTRKAQEWSLRMLEAQGPFFPKVMALETLGMLGTVHFIPEVMDYLSDENPYVYGAAERALGRMGEAIIAPAVGRIEAGTLDPDASHSVLVLLCDMGTRAAYQTVVDHLDGFMKEVGAGTVAEWVSLFGTEELIDPLRDWLEEDAAVVGQSLLLLGAIHDVPIPEEDDILQAIEDARATQGHDPNDDEAEPSSSDQRGGSYVM